jgi:hypothetical protein
MDRLRYAFLSGNQAFAVANWQSVPIGADCNEAQMGWCGLIWARGSGGKYND